MAIGDLSQYAVVSITPETNLDLITCTNPLGVVPKLVRVKTTDRTTRTSCIYEFVLQQEFCAELHRFQNEERAREGFPTDSTPSTSTYRQYRMTSDTIEIVRSASAAVWEAGITYTFHIYA